MAQPISDHLGAGGLNGAVPGDKVAAAVEVGRDLMRRDPAKCKAGYSRDSAVLAVARLYDLDEQQQAQVRERLPEEPND